MASQSKTLYIGVTNNIARRMAEHKLGEGSRFAAKYRITKLVFLEETSDIHAAIEREKQLKGWLRSKKLALIEAANPEWDDLSLGWREEAESDG